MTQLRDSALARRIKAELIALQDKQGRLEARNVWQWAQRNKKSALHRQFIWDTSKAAQAHWLDTARGLITRYVTVEILHRAEHIVSVMYVPDPTKPTSTPGYIALSSAAIERRDATRILLNELERIEAAIERARGVAAVLDAKHSGVASQLQEMLERVIGVRDAMGMAA